MRRTLLALVALGALLTPALHAIDSTSALGSGGEVYRVASGTYKALFPTSTPPGAANNPVLALDVVRNGKQQRLLVPGTEGPDAERAPALTIDPVSNRVYLVWQGQQNIHSVFNLIGYGADGWGDIFEFSGNVFSTKSNPQLAATVDHYAVIDASGNVVRTDRTILHMVWFDDSGVGERALYTSLVITDGEIQRSNLVFDLQELATGEPAHGAANSTSSLLQRPQIRAGRDGDSVVIGFVSPSTGDLLTLELRPVTGDVISFGDQARAQVIETGRNHPGSSRLDLSNLARAQVIETGRKLLRTEVADYLAQTFLGSVAASDPAEDLDTSMVKARAQVIETGVALHGSVADKTQRRVIEISQPADDGSDATQLADVRTAARRSLAAMPASDLKLFISSHGDEAAVAWLATATTVAYRETSADADGWGPLRTLSLGPNLDADDAFALVAQRTGSR